MGRTIAIGDIHGCNTALAVLVRSLKVQPDDTVIVLGDVIDRGRTRSSASTFCCSCASSVRCGTSWGITRR